MRVKYLYMLAISLICATLLMSCTAIEFLAEEYTNDREQETMSEEQASIGQATMRDDGTIVLRLRAESDDGAIGESLFTYAPDDDNYQSILDHIGGLTPGENKPVPPWENE